MRTLIVCAILLMSLSLAWAERLPITYTEPDMAAAGLAGQLFQTCVRICYRPNTSATTCREEMIKVCTAASDPDGGGVISLSPGPIVPIDAGQLPLTARYCTQVITLSGNSSDPWADCNTKTWTSP